MKEEIQEALDAGGLRLTKEAEGAGESRAFKTRAMDALPRSERMMNRNARIVRILEGDAKSSIEGKVAHSAYPELAKEYVRLFVFFQTRHSLPPIGIADLNPFRGLSERDAGAKMDRLLEDICDRSTGRMGPWTNGISVTQAARR